MTSPSEPGAGVIPATGSRRPRLVGVKREARWWLVRVATRVDGAVRSLSSSRRHGRRRVLLVAQNSLMSAYVLAVHSACADLHGVDWWMRCDEAGARTHRPRTLRPAGRLRSWLGGWDAIVLAEHAPLRFSRRPPRIIVPHGAVRSKLLREGSYFYSRQFVLWPDGEPVYAAMFDLSEAAADWGVRAVPELRGRVQVTGDLRTDQLVRHAQTGRGDEPPAVPTVALMSSWRPDSLYRRLGSTLFEEVARLASGGNYRFVVCAHPNLWTEVRGLRPLARELTALRREPNVDVVGPGEGWELPLAAADVAIADYTSLAASFAALRRPIGFLEGCVEDVGADTVIAALYANAPARIAQAPDLEPAIQALLSADVRNWMEPLMSRAMPHLGRSEQRTREAVASILGLET